MKKWYGSAGVCINEEGQVLMVLQGRPDEKKMWAIPSGGKENDVTFKECCVREIEEETGYLTEILEEIKIKRITYEKLAIVAEVHYFLVRVIGGERSIQDPDQLIYDVDWKGVAELNTMELTYPDDRDFLMSYIS